MQFDLPKEQSSIIKVFGVGGGGSNAVNHMYQQGIKGVDFIICNTDQQALDVSPVPIRIQLGSTLTEGRGAGSIPDVGKNAAIEDLEKIKEILEKNTKMVFITAGMGGGTGTGAAPIIAQAAKEMGILTVGIVTMPFLFEGRKRKLQASDGIEAMRENVDTLLVINNDKLREIFGNLSLRHAFEEADNVLTTAAKGIAEVITVTGQINVDFEDVRTVMSDSGVAIMGSAKASGEDRAMRAVEEALASPLLNDNNIEGANYVLLNITYGNNEIMMDEIADITDFIQDEAGNSADVIWGHGFDESLGDDICVTVIATGFKNTPDTGEIREVKKKVMKLEDDVPTTLTQSLDNEIDKQDTPQKEESKVEEKPLFEEPYIKEPSKPEQGSISFDLPASNNEEKEAVEENNDPQPTWDFQSTVPTTNEEVIAASPEQDNFSSESSTNETNDEESWQPYLKESGKTELNAETPAEENWTTTSSSSQMEEPYIKKQEQTPKMEETRPVDRIGKLKELSMRLRTPSGIADMENEPAYKRRQVKLEDTPHSSESQVSRYTLGEEETSDGESRAKLGDNNSFLHDNVD